MRVSELFRRKNDNTAQILQKNPVGMNLCQHQYYPQIGGRYAAAGLAMIWDFWKSNGRVYNLWQALPDEPMDIRGVKIDRILLAGRTRELPREAD